jgi:hypothetical protein
LVVVVLLVEYVVALDQDLPHKNPQESDDGHSIDLEKKEK